MHNVLKETLQILTESNLKKNNKLVNYQSADELKAILDLDKNIDPQQWNEIFIWVKQYLDYSPNTAHPNFINRMWSGSNAPSIVGEIVTAFSNTSGCTFESAPVATLMEKYMIEQMLEIVDFKQGEGQMTTGSSNANMIAMMVARNQTLTTVKQTGLFNQKRLFAFVSQDAHYSLDKAANILGIGTDCLIKIPTLDNGKMDTEILAEKIKWVQDNGGLCFFVCATLGTTVRGAYDDIEKLLKLKKKYHFWLHGDGAWGGAVIMNDKLKDKYLSGLNQLDSFTMDFHKMLGSNLMCNFLLLNYQHLLSCTCADGDSSYIFRDNDIDLGANSLQCGRRVDSLKWFLDWKFYTKQGFSDRVERYYALAEFAQSFIEQSKYLEMVVKCSSFNLCFRFKSNHNNQNNLNQCLRDKLHQEQIALLSLAYIGDKLVFRLLISNINLDKMKLSNLFERLITIGREIECH
ncbi:hypothetical protein [uncultured Gammaproteobacteria bacterium]|uniref:pyridoxal phosphate-dependent decarboxylase family protein n=1 Tax=Bathymodiolus heckerae thiotrophic gill symbiont TaxID=1052212 RepID=UPI0010B84FA6|nr:pyridoxal-dependent decarboxylase [Bathymodiolus heckerae thiotrophic gill symbiont]CAC9592959.1 hypothetical protein [uncultured Gammaproteobacteria bacterium]CAC9599727.1 hypothetical protein [uncultured Gammaproteobacteria bacterium]CAC9600752.1 hypothetical protein [uncultured Gammaproteobacteria bacterium]CAC9608064.1 hypothetical protein [uncultured Gammaproteobacteria bacterium]CAC9960802.1 hypothetical protein [uncultured Gammaproteobacteria bacterium]